MRKLDPCSEVEAMLKRLMPVSLGEGVRVEIEDRLDELSGDADFTEPRVIRFSRWIAALGIAAALVLGFVMFPHVGKIAKGNASQRAVVVDDAPSVVLLNEAERMEGASDEGLFVDSGGSAVRKLRIRVVGESKMLDEESGIVVTLAEPREEMYLVPVSTF